MLHWLGLENGALANKDKQLIHSIQGSFLHFPFISLGYTDVAAVFHPLRHHLAIVEETTTTTTTHRQHKHFLHNHPLYIMNASKKMMS